MIFRSFATAAPISNLRLPRERCAAHRDYVRGAFDSETSLLELSGMTKHLPPIPLANRSNKGTGDASEPLQDDSVKRREPENISEQGETANIKQNTNNKGYFYGRRVK
jgi:hypothetical protein